MCEGEESGKTTLVDEDASPVTQQRSAFGEEETVTGAVISDNSLDLEARSGTGLATFRRFGQSSTSR